MNKILFAIIFISIVLIIYYFYQDNVSDNGKVYSSKRSLCNYFAQSYLQTMAKKEGIGFQGLQWEMAIDVETEMYNLCMIDLNKESLKNYKPSAFERYE